MRHIKISVLFFLIIFSLTACDFLDLPLNDGSDVCETGEKLIDDKCVKDDDVLTCLEDQELIDNECKDKEIVLECTADEEIIDGECNPIEVEDECLHPQAIIDGECKEPQLPQTDLEYAQWVLLTQSDTIVKIDAKK